MKIAEKWLKQKAHIYFSRKQFIYLMFPAFYCRLKLNQNLRQCQQQQQQRQQEGAAKCAEMFKVDVDVDVDVYC